MDSTDPQQHLKVLAFAVVAAVATTFAYAVVVVAAVAAISFAIKFAVADLEIQKLPRIGAQQADQGAAVEH